MTRSDLGRLVALAQWSGGPFLLTYHLSPHFCSHGPCLEPAARLELSVTGQIGAGFVPRLSEVLTGNPLALTTPSPGATAPAVLVYRPVDIAQRLRGTSGGHQA